MRAWIQRNFNKFQIGIAAIFLAATFILMISLILRHNYRWDTTKEKIYSLAPSTIQTLQELKGLQLKVYVFYPQETEGRHNFEVFLKECQRYHPKFSYFFYDPDRAPSMAKSYQVDELYTVVIEAEDRQERIVRPSEEDFTNALLKLAHPKALQLCFATGHGEASLEKEDRTGLAFLRKTLQLKNYGLHEIIIMRDKIPDVCDAVILAGPRYELEPEEWESLKQAFGRGQGILFLIDPMDPGTGGEFEKFMGDFGIALGRDVIIDKISRVVGGDFLIPLVSQYLRGHPVTDTFNEPTFFPVARSVQPSSETIPDLDVVPLAISSSGSWAESNLKDLEEGKAVFEPEYDLAGPVSLAAAVEQIKRGEDGEEESRGRMVVVGDSDFVVNAYLHLSGNSSFVMRILRWITQDDRFIKVETRQPDFSPLFIHDGTKHWLIGTVIVALPGLFFLTGAWIIYRRKRKK